MHISYIDLFDIRCLFIITNGIEWQTASITSVQYLARACYKL